MYTPTPDSPLNYDATTRLNPKPVDYLHTDSRLAPHDLWGLVEGRACHVLLSLGQKVPLQNPDGVGRNKSQVRPR